MTRYVLMAFGLVLMAQRGQAEPPPDPSALEFFEREVRPLLVGRCQECHGAEKQKGDLRLDSRAAILAAAAPGRQDRARGRAGQGGGEPAGRRDQLRRPLSDAPQVEAPGERDRRPDPVDRHGGPLAGRRPAEVRGEGGRRHLRPRGAREALELPADPGPRAPRGPGPRLAEGRRSIGSSWRRWRPRASRRHPRPTGVP